MDDAQKIIELQEKILSLEERLRALEKEQRMICQDILSGRSKEHMQQRLLEKPTEKLHEIKERLDEQIRIEI
ncbi:hypothetical protein AYK24_10530 [Thermoplasmatales archaeon SG8-52-4]|nr:MAG: hypothetical protein AYK24_10530 [Thermoplasmatales archaeon SG8-52-4]